MRDVRNHLHSFTITRLNLRRTGCIIPSGPVYVVRVINERAGHKYGKLGHCLLAVISNPVRVLQPLACASNYAEHFSYTHVTFYVGTARCGRWRSYRCSREGFEVAPASPHPFSPGGTLTLQTGASTGPHPRHNRCTTVRAPAGPRLTKFTFLPVAVFRKPGDPETPRTGNKP